MKRFLIVEDDLLSCRILEDVMSEFATCDTAYNGEKGFELFEAAILSGVPYDLVCSDIIMPGIDGHEFVKKIRLLEDVQPVSDCPRTRIFMISSSDTPEDMARALLDNNCNDYIVKPFRREALVALLHKYNLLTHTNEP